MSGRSSMNVDSVGISGMLTLGEFTVTAADLDGNGVLTISPDLQGVTLILDKNLTLSGIKIVDTDGATDITTSSGGVTMFVACDDPTYPSACTIEHEALAATDEHRFDCPSASGGPRTSVTIGRPQTSIRYSGTLQRWICPNWSA